MTDLARIVWRLDAYAAHWLTDDELTAVTEWMAANRMDRSTAERPVVVERGTISYGQDRSPSTVRSPDRDIVMRTVPLRTAPPVVRDIPRRTADALASVFARHEWSAGFGGVCVDCSRIQIDEQGRVWCHRRDTAPWPCPPVSEALSRVGLRAADGPRRILGDCLDPVDNARAFR